MASLAADDHATRLMPPQNAARQTATASSSSVPEPALNRASVGRIHGPHFPLTREGVPS